MPAKNLKLLFAVCVILFSGCQTGQQDSKSTNTEQSNFHKIVVHEVLQASEYTYLHARQDNSDIWLAVPSMQAKPGDTYYYEGGITMQKFESKELNRVFESIILLEKLNTEPKSSAIVASDKPYANPSPDNSHATSQNNPPTMNHDNTPATTEGYTRKATPPEKKEVKVTIPKGGISIADLYAHKESYAGKTVIVKGQVTKYTPAVMNKNWIHIQDGTDNNGKFDLAITSTNEMKVGDVVTFEGKISLNKDLGYGYFFDVIMEDAVVK
jgi:hypothetical protein